MILVLVGLMACGSRTEEREALAEEAVWAEMDGHHADAVHARDAVVAGDLDAARTAARRLAADRRWGTLPADRRPSAEATLVAARALGDAEDVVTAARALGDLGQGCASCHAASPTRPTSPRPPEAEPGDGIAALMGQHRRTADLLWAGLVTPDDALLAEGASNLLTHLPLTQSAIAERFPESELATGLEARVVELVAAVRDAPPDGRGRAYAELVTLCATCHLLSGDGPTAAP
jgi:cytochrome c556